MGMPHMTSAQAVQQNNRDTGGRYATKVAAESDVAIATAPDPSDPSTWVYDWPQTVSWDETRSMIDGYEDSGWQLGSLPGLADATFELNRDYQLCDGNGGMSPREMVADMDWDEDEEAEAEELVDSYEFLQDTLVERPWDVAPLVVAVLPDGRTEVLDGNHRASFALDVNRTSHPAYVAFL